jgi:hypothetical protein
MGEGRRPSVLRMAVFCALALYIALGPVFPHLLRVGDNWGRAWAMFGGLGKHICHVHYSRVVDGRSVPLDRFALLTTPGQPGPRGLRHIRNIAAAVAIGRRLCRVLGPDADVRLDARCGESAGWRVSQRPDQNLCDPSLTRQSR